MSREQQKECPDTVKADKIRAMPINDYNMIYDARAAEGARVNLNARAKRPLFSRLAGETDTQSDDPTVVVSSENGGGRQKRSQSRPRRLTKRKQRKSRKSKRRHHRKTKHTKRTKRTRRTRPRTRR